MTPEAKRAYEAGLTDGRSHFQEVPPSPHYIYVQNPEGTASPDMKTNKNVAMLPGGVFMDFKTWVAAAGALILMVVWGSRQFSDIQYEIKDLRTVLVNQTSNFAALVKGAVDPVSARISTIERDLAIRTQSRWTRADQEIWCLKTERENKDIGWKCGGARAGDERALRGEDLEPFQYYSPDYQSQGWTPTITKPMREAMK